MTAPGMPVVRRPKGEVLAQVLDALVEWGPDGALLHQVVEALGKDPNLMAALLRGYWLRGHVAKVVVQRGHTRYFARQEWAAAWAERAKVPVQRAEAASVPPVEQVRRLMRALGVQLRDLIAHATAAPDSAPRQLVTAKPVAPAKPVPPAAPRRPVLQDVVRHAQAPLRPVPTGPDRNTTAIRVPKAPKQGLARDVAPTNPNGVVPIVCPAGQDTRYQVTAADLARPDSLGFAAEWRRRTGQA